ncbi:UDP-glucose--hexose-1-phosphate uridylyltransferase [Clostridium tertium]|jgi:UDPglucose--hexose-1-phosphate uridylyltransferase|uniref:Galactose-1-phosphate uridylyltransferase n=1 Tax=Clostridium tertium TaxID=1559 RepID=A0A9X3XIL4_9CLOT|nr:MULTISPECIES: UDP-glucose--hexose-1-phosphate uridylyltransferase [Clostridium]MBU6135559.1 UDP-glucose--hexose-1-phosphate uridylyltransferase [Clostridium tertium]MDB1923466.1 UDP-glucose--hexose-1-phosphate uridylyltransferase [Clostridium tertium]MDB1927363.1 UDP-glucose--hexose-1-phosphate uridylyltransferase [Clostridium tertium]MDB1930987.1 UDP-glucose--hexose-1-phosphate uridylyltransferase [Clostridium tertium]MDB1939435.1 UDP-glucose--hexose-1-phosphate uridylyltransferase [Clostr
MNIYREIKRLIQYGLKHELFTKDDEIFIRNGLLDVLNLDEYEDFEIDDENLNTPTEILGNILDYAFNNGILESNSPIYRDLLDTKIMGVLMPRPSEVIREFYNRYKESKESATSYLYNISKACDYVRTDRIAQNLVWKSSTEYGDLDITINLSKPEKDPKAIAAAKNLPPAKYPKCLLCKENEGYRGRINHPARQNIRIIPMELNNESWYLQYSPYAYYNEHCIVFAGEHVPMKITKNTFNRLLEFIEKFPHYFVGSNADLPIVGGSILTHDHYQGGNYEFAMDKAKDVYKFNLNSYKNIELSIVKWPLTVLRLKGRNRIELSELADKVLVHWRNYSDSIVDVYSCTNEIPHNTITPIARKDGEFYVLDLVLRNNRTSEEHPDGIFHPHKELHNIKKENIGLIEVLGLAVLPARLKDELEIIKLALVNDTDDIYNNEEMKIHLNWYEEIKRNNQSINKENVDSIIEKEVGKVFSKVLEHCGVFKWDEDGKEAMKRYINSLKETIN